MSSENCWPTQIDEEAKKEIDSKKLKKAPLRYVKDAHSTLDAIQIYSIQDMSEEDRKELSLILDKIEEKINEIRSGI